VGTSVLGLRDHRLEAPGLLAQCRDAPLGPLEGVEGQRAPLAGVGGRAEALAGPGAGLLVLEQPADLREGEPYVIAKAADEAEPFDIRRVLQPVRALGSTGGTQQPELLVVPDRARREAHLRGGLVDAQHAVRPGRIRTASGVPLHPTHPTMMARPSR